jgi:general secretion pathway protein A
MFIDHFQMTSHPFTEKPHDQALLCDERFDQALARLKFFRDQGQLALITGYTGVGKSSLLKLFKKDLPRNRCRHHFFNITSLNANAFLRMIVSRLGEPPKMGKDRLFLQIISRIRNTETDTLFFIDEAHLLPSQALIDLRLLLIGNGDDAVPPLKIVLCGQEPLASRLKRSELADLDGRINVRIRLTPLTKFQTTAYINHRLKSAGSSEKIFDSDAKDLIHDFSGGIPRTINHLATICLINAASKNLSQVNDQIVNHSMIELR